MHVYIFISIYIVVICLVLLYRLCIFSVPETYLNTPDVKYYVINLREREDKLRNFEQFFGTEYIRIEAVNGDDLTESWSCLPSTVPSGYKGYKGLQMSNIAVFDHAIQNNYEYIVILEDDAEPPQNFKEIVLGAIAKQPGSQVINMDSRNHEGGEWGCCTSAVLYHQSVFRVMRQELDPATSMTMKTFKRKYNYDCLFDYLVPKIIAEHKMLSSSIPTVPSGRFVSDINTRKL